MEDENMGGDARVNWGILGTGFIADAFAYGVEHSKTGRLVAVASRSQGGADAFAAARDGGVRALASYGEMYSATDVDAIYVATPHPFHASLAIGACDAGKAVLCEKPIGVSRGEAERIVDAARRNRSFLMEAYMVRCAPQTRAISEIIADGLLGEIISMDASFSFRETFDPQSRLFDPSLAGGGILDVGGYPVTMAALVAGAMDGGGWQAPESLVGAGVIGESGVDEYATAVARYPSGLVARLSCGISVDELPGGIRIHGTDGTLVAEDAWIPAKFGGSTTISILRPGGRATETIEVESPLPLYALEADVAGAAILRGAQQPDWPAVGWDETCATMAVLDSWKEAVIRSV